MENLKIFILSVVFLIVSSCRGLKRINALSLLTLVALGKCLP